MVDFRLTPDQEQWRRELQNFLDEALADAPTRSYGESVPQTPAELEFERVFTKRLAAKGWIAPPWPKEYGGLSASHVEQAIFNEELAYAGAPDGGRSFGTGMIGPTLIVHGTEEQKRRHLPAITGGDVIWSQAYSEPGAGSDLASLQTRAVRDGDDYVINGQKIWTTGAHRANWMFILARTDPDAPKHRGISFFLCDMKTPGITVRPLINIAGYHEFNEVFLEDVRVPVENRVGDENRGWYVGMTLLDFERASVKEVAVSRRILEDLADYVRERPTKLGIGLEEARWGLAQLWTENQVAQMMAYRTATIQDAGKVPSYEASMNKVFATESTQRLFNFAVNLLGLYGQLDPDPRWDTLYGRVNKGYLLNLAPTIYSGANEIQRNIIAQRGLGLPRQ